VNRPVTNAGWQPSDAELRASLEEVLGPARPIRRLSHQAYAYRTSFPLEEISLCLANGTTLSLLCKCTSWEALTPSAQQAKPSFLHDPLREIETYRHILSSLDLGTPIYYGSMQDEPTGKFWLFMEKVSGQELYQVGELASWEESARWLANLHTLALTPLRLREWKREAHLLELNEPYYRRWMARVLEYAPSQDRSREIQAVLRHLAKRFEQLSRRLQAVPCSFVHGEFYASNVLIQRTPSGVRIAPVDWEMAAIGPCLVDLAALTAGSWKDAERQAIALAYHRATPRRGAWPLPVDAFLEALDVCRLLLAIQWLGWSRDWVPPREHNHDWLGEALGLADKLRL
jgi:aminoglycoside phosphotransferase (APT) family kinase protein